MASKKKTIPKRVASGATPKTARKANAATKSANASRKQAAASATGNKKPARPRTKKKTGKAAAQTTDKPVVHQTKPDRAIRPKDSSPPEKKLPAAAPASQPAAPPGSTVLANAQEHLSDKEVRKIKSGLSKKDMTKFKQMLLERRAAIVGAVQNMEETRNNSGGDIPHMPQHMADIGSDNYEQEFTLGLVESERMLLREIDEALLRIQNRTYGVCLVKGIPIPKARIEAKPWAKYCIEVARERERRSW